MALICRVFPELRTVAGAINRRLQRQPAEDGMQLLAHAIACGSCVQLSEVYPCAREQLEDVELSQLSNTAEAPLKMKSTVPST